MRGRLRATLTGEIRGEGSEVCEACGVGGVDVVEVAAITTVKLINCVFGIVRDRRITPWHNDWTNGTIRRVLQR